MKTIGRIEPQEIDDKLIVDEYNNGYIIQLTESEMTTFRRLIASIEEQKWNTNNLRDLLYGKLVYPMDDVFKIIHVFVLQKLAVNDLKKSVSDLENILNGLESNND